MKELLKKFATFAAGDYALYHIYSKSIAQSGHSTYVSGALTCACIDKVALEASPDEVIADQAGYHGAGAYAYACLDGSRIIAVCFFWYGERYLQRNYWPLADAEAKLVQIVTIPDMRGRGVATQLIRYSAEQMFQRGFRRLFARVWHSNTPSLKAFERAGWARIATVVDVYPLRSRRRCRFTIWSRRGGLPGVVFERA